MEGRSGVSFGPVARTEANIILLAPSAGPASGHRAGMLGGAANQLAVLTNLLTTLLHEVSELNASGAMPGQVDRLVVAAGRISGSLEKTTSSLLAWHQAASAPDQPVTSAKSSA